MATGVGWWRKEGGSWREVKHAHFQDGTDVRDAKPVGG